ncbi:hypothetical protein KAR34_04915 [bacterium]|nr:hypothetical protein [bacterium]
MAENIDKLQRLFPKLNIKKGKIVSLSESKLPLTAHVTAQPLDDYLAEI